jgi:PAS domain S-box-containing protein
LSSGVTPVGDRIQSDYERAFEALQRLAALVESSDDAILSLDLEGRVTSWNRAATDLYGYSAEEVIGQSISMVIPSDRAQEEREILARISKGERVEHYETLRKRKDGALVEISLTVSPIKNPAGDVVGASKIARNIHERRANERLLRDSEIRARQQSHRLEVLNKAAQIISSDLDTTRIVQTVTDLARDLTGAKFGAFFYNVVDDAGDRYVLYTLSGAPRAAFENFGLPRNTAVFEPTFRGEGVVRSPDIRKDPRYGKNAPHFGMPKGHPPVVSYLAVPVTSRSGEVIGGLFFGHEEEGVFSEEAEALVTGLAAHAAIAIDNARLHQSAQHEIDRRRRAEERQDVLLREVKHRAKNTIATIQAMAVQTFRGASKEEQAAFNARVRAMAEALDLLTNRDWDRAPIEDVIARAIVPFEDVVRRRFTLVGPGAALSSDVALALALALHELATNAIKYGALSNEKGRVTIAWSLGEGSDAKLRLSWRESDGPPVAPPTRTGFGTLLIERTLGGNGKTARMEFAPTGLVCTLDLATS